MRNIVQFLGLVGLVIWVSSCGKPLSLAAGHEPRIAAPEQPIPFVQAPKKLIGIFVNANSNAVAPDGKSWASAYKNIQDAVLVAQGQIIYVAAGEYKRPNIEIKDMPTLTLVAGYQANDMWEKDLSALKPQDDVILDGEAQPQALISISGKSKSITLRGPLVFRNTLGASAVSMIGTPAKPLRDIIIANARFENNQYAAGNGAGIFVQYAKYLNIDNINAKANTAQNGGFIYADQTEKLIINGGVWENNTATANGGAFYGLNSQRLSLKPNSISGGRAVNGGAIYLSLVRDSDIADLMLEKNSSTQNGGAVFLNQVSDTKLSFANATISGNIAVNTGGALAMTDCEKVDLRGGRFIKNKAAFRGGVISGLRTDGMDIGGAFFEGNKSDNSGGVFSFVQPQGIISLHDLTIRKNEAAGHGGVIFVDDQQDNSAINLRDAIFTENTATKNGGVAMFKAIQGTVSFNKIEFNGNVSNGFGGALALDAKTHASAKYIIDEGTTFRGNSSKKNAGGGAILAVFNETHAPAIRLDFNTIIPIDDSTTNSSANTNGYFLRVSNQSVVAAPGSGERDPPGAPKKITNILFPQLVDFASTGLTIDEGKNVYQY